MNATLKPRRKPSQSRAWMTSGAIQDAFVQLLVEQGYEKVSMRDIAGVAGVGLGTLYEYFPGKDSIAAVTIRARTKKLAALEQGAPAAAGASSLAQTVRALVQAHVGTLLGQPAEWAALLFLERRLTSPDNYRALYREFVHLFRDALAAAPDWPARLDAERTAYNVFSIVDAMAKHALLVQETPPGVAELMADVECAVNGYLELATRRP